MAADNKSPLSRFFRDNGLSLALFTLFVACLFGDSVFGRSYYNQDEKSPIGYWQYWTTGHFWDGVWKNWQAATLQLFVLVSLGSALVQRGASHSRNPDQPGDKPSERGEPPEPNTAKGILRWLYEHSLSLAFFVLFLVSFFLEIFFGTQAYNRELSLEHKPPVSLSEYVVSARLWFEIFQTWQAEFFAIAAYVVFSIFLRQKGSPESKSVRAKNRETGGTEK